MKILIVAATGKEIAPLIKIISAKNIKEGSIKSGFINSQKIDILLTGVGMVATAFHCAKKISGHYDFVINMGVAGSFKKNIPMGSVVNVVADRFSELGAENGEEFLTLKEMNLWGVDEIKENLPFKNKKIAALKKVRGITVNTVHGNKSSIKKIIKKFNPDIETMEGCAFLYACKNEGVPCVQIRAVSNMVEPRNKENWDIPLAIKNLNKTCIEIVHSMTG